MVSMGKLVWIQWEPDTNQLTGKNIRRENDFVLLNFAEHLKNIETSLYERNPVDSNNPVVTEKKLLTSYFSISERTISWNTLINMLNTAVNINSIIQKFNYSRSKKSCVLRV